MFYMRTENMIDSMLKNNGFTLGVCFLIQVYKNPEITSFYLQKEIFGSKNFINEIALIEAKHNGFDKTEILLKMKKLFGQVIVKDVPNEARFFGQQLEKSCPILHSGDSAILTFTKRTSTTLVALDENLAKACLFFDDNCIILKIIQKHGGRQF